MHTDTETYLTWRDKKRQAYHHPPNIFVEINQPHAISHSEQQKIFDLCQCYNFAIFCCRNKPQQDKKFVQQLGQTFGLHRLDGNLYSDIDNITSLKVATNRTDKRQDYIPYTNKPLSWHTDGYYNLPQYNINGMILYCAQNSAQGGSNKLLDHEMAYILLREANPDYIQALMQPNVMTIPANIMDGQEIRPTQTGPVFSISRFQHLHMRYTARKHNIIWTDDETTTQAMQTLTHYLKDNPYIFQHTLQPGQGLICNNILHNRTPFENSDQQQRLVYRARYYDRILKC